MDPTGPEMLTLEKISQRLASLEKSELLRTPILTIAKGVLLGWLFIVVISFLFWLAIWGCALGGLGRALTR